MLDSSSPVPLHHQLAELLRDEIATGTYPPGVRLPTEGELCVRFDVSRTPVRKAMQRLADEGVVVRYRRRGSFVVDAHQPASHLEVAIFPGEPEDWSALMRRLTAGDAPEAALVPAGWVAELTAMGALAAVTTPPDPIEVLAVPEGVAAMWEQGDVHRVVPVSVDLHGLWIRRSALGAIGGRPPTAWADLRSLALAARDLDNEVSSPVVLPGGAAGGRATVMAGWLLLAASGGGFGGAGPLTVASAGTRIFGFIRQMIDTGLMSPDVVGFTSADVAAALRAGAAVAGVGPASLLAQDEDSYVFTGFPGDGHTVVATATLAECLVGVVPSRASFRGSAEHRLAQLRTKQLRPLSPGLLATAHAPPVTEHYRAFGASTIHLMDDIISGRSTVDAAVGRFAVAGDILGA